jgi:cell filamentation protein
VVVDPYVDPDTDVLHNRLGLADAGALERAEADFTNARALELVDSPIGGAFDYTHLRTVHRHLFQDVYEWAGEPRTVAIAKSDRFCLPEHIAGD